jgi:hypothetical protein
MARYYFHVQNGQYYPDDEGTVLASPEVARLESIAAASDMLVAGRKVCRLTVSAKIEVSGY